MVPAANFDANRDVDALRKAMKGFGTNEKTLINILGNRTTEQRMRIKDSYKAKLNRVRRSISNKFLRIERISIGFTLGFEI